MTFVLRIIQRVQNTEKNETHEHIMTFDVRKRIGHLLKMKSLRQFRAF